MIARLEQGEHFEVWRDFRVDFSGLKNLIPLEYGKDGGKASVSLIHGSYFMPFIYKGKYYVASYDLDSDDIPMNAPATYIPKKEWMEILNLYTTVPYPLNNDRNAWGGSDFVVCRYKMIHFKK